MPPHQSDAHLEVLLDRLFSQLQHAACRGAIDRDGFFHEDVDALFDGVREMHPAEGRRRGEDRHIARPQTIDGPAVAVKADELAVLGHVDLRLHGLFQMPVAGRQPVLEHVRHGHQFDRTARCRQRVHHGAAAPPTAPDQRHSGSCCPHPREQAGRLRPSRRRRPRTSCRDFPCCVWRCSAGSGSWQPLCWRARSFVVQARAGVVSGQWFGMLHRRGAVPIIRVGASFSTVRTMC